MSHAKLRSCFLTVVFILSFSGTIAAQEDLAGRVEFFKGLVANEPDPDSKDHESIVAFRARSEAIKELEEALASGELLSRAEGSSAPYWEPIGPYPVKGEYFGEPEPRSYANYSGRVTAIVVHPHDFNVAYVGTANGGVWRHDLSAPPDQEWAPLSDQEVSLAIGALTLDPSHPYVIYAGTGEKSLRCDSYFGAGILKSTDGGGSWTLIDQGFFAGHAISKIIVHPSNPDLVWVATTPGVGGHVESNTWCAGPGFGDPQYGVYMSVNGGAPPWTMVFDAAQGSTDDYITDLELESASTNSFLIGAAEIGADFGTSVAGIYRASFPNPPPQSPVTGTKIWNQEGAPLIRTEVELRLFNPGVVYATAATDLYEDGASESFFSYGSFHGVFRSANAGIDWTELQKSGLSTNHCQAERLNPQHAVGPTVVNACERTIPGRNQCDYDLVLELDNSGRLWLGGIGLWRGTYQFGNMNWDDMCFYDNNYANEKIHVDQQAIAIGDNHIWLGNDGGLFSLWGPSTEWQDHNGAGFSITQFYPGASIHDAEDDTWAVAGTQDLGIVRYHEMNTTEEPWIQLRGEYTRNGQTLPVGFWTDGSETAFDPDFDIHASFDDVWVSQVGGMLFFSDDFLSTQNFQLMSGNTPGPCFLENVAVCPGDGNRVITTSCRTYKTSNNKGLNWDYGNGTIGDGNVPHPRILTTSFTPDCLNAWIGGHHGWVARSINGGHSSEKFRFKVNGQTMYVSVTDIEPDPNDPNVVYLSAGGHDDLGHIFKTTNAMELSVSDINFVRIDAGIPNAPVTSLLLDQRNPSILYAGSGLGIFRSVDGGSWELFNQDLPNSPVYDLVQDGEQIIAFTHGRGAWRLVEQGSIEVLSPNGGENWKPGATETITWSDSGTISHVDIEIARTPWDRFVPIAQNVSNEGSYDWTVTWPPHWGVRIRVSDANDPSIHDVSDDQFTIDGEVPYYADTFSDPDEPTPSPLAGRETEINGGTWGTWAAHSGLLVNAGGYVSGTGIAGLEAPPIDVAFQSSSVVAKVDPTGSDWVAIGLNQSATGAFWKTGELYVLLRPSGAWAVRQFNTTIASGSTLLYPGEMNSVELSYYRADFKSYMRLIINGKGLVKEQEIEHTPSLGYAGVHIHLGSGETHVDDFGWYLGF